MRADDHCRRVLADGFAAIRAEERTPGPFPAEVLEAAQRAEAADVAREDLTAEPFVTLDPAESTDLDQAFALRVDGDVIELMYAIADIGAFVPAGGVVDVEAARRGVTYYAPDGTIPLYPPALSQAKASLLPDGPRPALVARVRVDRDGAPSLAGIHRAWVRSRAKLAYESVTPAELPSAMGELVRRLEAAEAARGAFRVELPSQEIVRDDTAPGGLRLRFAPRLASEEHNAALSLAANLAVAAALQARGAGLFRVMDDPDARELAFLRRLATTLGLRWRADEGLRAVVPRLDPDDARHVAFVIAARRAAGGARYETRAAGAERVPWHAAVAATYAHATAPMRRLADRSVLEMLLGPAGESGTGQASAAGAAGPMEALADVMNRAERTAARVDRACIDLVECVSLLGREGELFDALVVDSDRDAVTVQLLEPAVRARVRAASLRGADPGERVRLRLQEVVLEERRVVLAPGSSGPAGRPRIE